MDHKNGNSENGENLAVNFGALLRQSREEAGYTLERAATATRISPMFIQALEAGQFERLPGLVFARGFIRNLCKAYGKNSVQFLETFDLALNGALECLVDDPVKPQTPTQESPQINEDDTLMEQNSTNASNIPSAFAGIVKENMDRLRQGWESLKPALLPYQKQIYGGAAAFTLLVMLLVSVLGNDDKSEPIATVAQTEPMVVEDGSVPLEPTGVPQPQSLAVESATTADSDEHASPSASSEPVAESTPAQAAVSTPEPVEPEEKAAVAVAKTPAPAPVKKPASETKQVANVGLKADSQREKQVLEIQAKDKVVVRLVRDGGKPEMRTLEARDHVFEFTREAQLLIFDASAVEVKFNGRTLGSLGKRGKVRRISFKKEEFGEAQKM